MKKSAYDLSTGNKGWPALVRSHKKQQKLAWERLYGKQNDKRKET